MLAIENIHDLEIALAASDQGSFSGAARVLGITQPAVSQAVARLERQLGTTLFDRQDSGHPGFLTDAGAILLAHAITALDELEAAVNDVAEFEGARSLRVGLPSLLARTFFPQGFDCMTQALQGRAVEIALHDSARLFDELRLHRVDVGMIATADLGIALPHVTFTKVVSYPLMLAVPAQEAVTMQAPCLEELAKEQLPVIAFSGALALRDMVTSQLQRAELQLNVVADTDQPEMLWRLVAAGMGVGLASGLAFEGAPSSIRTVLLAGPKMPQLHVFVFTDAVRARGPEREALVALRRQLFNAVRLQEA